MMDDYSFKMDSLRETVSSFLKKESPEGDQVKIAVERCLRSNAMLFPKMGTADVVQLSAFIQFVISLAKEEHCPRTLSIQILQDIFDASTIARCEQIFEVVENNIDTWKKPLFFDSCKNMVLRMCNDLLRRLSRTIDTTFCGRILILLAKFLPLSEKSGLNLTGQFNTQNITVYDKEKNVESEEPQHSQPHVEEDMEVGEIRESRDGGSIPVDYNLYTKFWGLQKFLSNPNLLFELDHFKQFENTISEVFGIFSTCKLERPQRQHEQSPPVANVITYSNNEKMVAPQKCEEYTDDQKNGFDEFNGYNSPFPKMEVDGNEQQVSDNPEPECSKKILFKSEHTFFAKYLTSQKLFPLQLADSQFRRYFLLQFLTISNYLVSKVRLRDTYSLTNAQEDTIKELTEKCYNLLKETYPHGTQFAESVKKTLAREKAWSSWKSDGCPDIITPLLNSHEKKCGVFKRKVISRYEPNSIDLGNKELTRLWNIYRGNLLACKDVQRKCIPDLKHFLEEALDEMDPDQQVEEQYQSVNDEKYQWMSSRFLLFNSDQYINYAALDSKVQAPSTSFMLKKTFQLTAENIPELKPRVDYIQSVIKKKETAERLRLATETKELEKKIKIEEEEQMDQMTKQESPNSSLALAQAEKQQQKLAETEKVKSTKEAVETKETVKQKKSDIAATMEQNTPKTNANEARSQQKHSLDKNQPKGTAEERHERERSGRQEREKRKRSKSRERNNVTAKRRSRSGEVRHGNRRKRSKSKESVAADAKRDKRI